MKLLNQALRLFVFLTLLTGLIYPLAVTGISQILFHSKANGSLIVNHGQVIGSELIAQNFKDPRHFWPRPSAVDYNPLPSGATNLGPTSKQLAETLNERKAKGLSYDLLFASGSGLDPHISPEAATIQVERIAKARSFGENNKAWLLELIKKHIEGRQFGFLGEPRINVLKLNLELDEGMKNE